MSAAASVTCPVCGSRLPCEHDPPVDEACHICGGRSGEAQVGGVRHRGGCPVPTMPTLAEACEVIEALWEALRVDCRAFVSWDAAMAKADAFLARVKRK